LETSVLYAESGPKKLSFWVSFEHVF